MSQQTEVLDRLLTFYSKRYKGRELDKKMSEAVQELIDSSDINLGAAMKFFADNDVEPYLKAKKISSSSSSSSSSYSDPCGGGGGASYRSHC